MYLFIFKFVSLPSPRPRRGWVKAPLSWGLLHMAFRLRPVYYNTSALIARLILTSCVAFTPSSQSQVWNSKKWTKASKLVPTIYKTYFTSATVLPITTDGCYPAWRDQPRWSPHQKTLCPIRVEGLTVLLRCRILQALRVSGWPLLCLNLMGCQTATIEVHPPPLSLPQQDFSAIPT